MCTKTQLALKVLAAGCSCLMLVCAVAPISRSEQTKDGPAGKAPSNPLPNRAEDCQRCHTMPTARDTAEGGALDFVLLTEYATWKTQDKHAQAFAMLKSDRGRQMEKLLKKSVIESETGCLGCHAMTSAEPQGAKPNLDDGVQCAGCHGPADDWLTPHWRDPKWRKYSPAEKAKLHMRDLRDPVTRAEICLSCHLGNAKEGKVVTHAMYAAGHPPLPSIEIATFSQNEPQHWRNPRDVPLFKQKDFTAEDKRNYHCEVDAPLTRQALVGSAVALRETMRLIMARTNWKTDDNPLTVWPELTLLPDVSKKPGEFLRASAEKQWPELAMAQFDCYACHHELQQPSWRQQRGYGYVLPAGLSVRGRPGRLQLHTWPMALVEIGIGHAAKDPVAAKKRATELLRALCDACDERPFGNPAAIAQASSALEAWCDKQLIPDLMHARYDDDACRNLLRELAALPDAAHVDYETAREITSVFQMIYHESTPPDKRSGEMGKVLDELTKQLNLRPQLEREGRQQLLVQVVEQQSKTVPADDVNKFIEAVKHPENLQLQRSMNDNKFLSALIARTTNEAISKAFQEKMVKRLQELDDKELSETLKKLRDYNPGKFKECWSDLGKRPRTP